MEQAFYNFIKGSTIIEKGVFLMVAGVCFVFVVQLVFYMVVKLWPKKAAGSE